MTDKDASTLNWYRRLEIALGVAQGLEYLHTFVVSNSSLYISVLLFNIHIKWETTRSQDGGVIGWGSTLRAWCEWVMDIGN